MLARVAMLALFATTALVACSATEERPACAASVPPPGPGSGSKPRPGSSKTTSGNATTTRTDTRPAPPQKTVTRPQQTSQGTWQRQQHQEPRRVYKPQPAKIYVTNPHGQRYVHYPSFPGYYVIGVYPVTYGATYGCTPAEVGEPVQDVNAG
ncbi:hypothetical protein ACFV1N_25360 [Streptosporangium canum]|uniref:hypothetical protein n=1 Tax=Streptosporangium canum TaxID=324952 RepID=UPI00368A0157